MIFLYNACKSYFVGQIIVYFCDLSVAQVSHSTGVIVQSLFCQEVHISSFYYTSDPFIIFSCILRQIAMNSETIDMRFDSHSKLCYRFVLEVFLVLYSWRSASCSSFSLVFLCESLLGLHNRDDFLIFW